MAEGYDQGYFSREMSYDDEFIHSSHDFARDISTNHIPRSVYQQNPTDYDVLAENDMLSTTIRQEREINRDKMREMREKLTASQKDVNKFQNEVEELKKRLKMQKVINDTKITQANVLLEELMDKIASIEKENKKLHETMEREGMDRKDVEDKQSNIEENHLESEVKRLRGLLKQEQNQNKSMAEENEILKEENEELVTRNTQLEEELQTTKTSLEIQRITNEDQTRISNNLVNDVMQSRINAVGNTAGGEEKEKDITIKLNLPVGSFLANTFWMVGIGDKLYRVYQGVKWLLSRIL